MSSTPLRGWRWATPSRTPPIGRREFGTSWKVQLFSSKQIGSRKTGEQIERNNLK